MGGDFVDSGKRRLESIRGLAQLGIDLDRQHYAGLSDGRLQNQITILAGNIIDLANRNGFTNIVSFGADGFDGHEDHKAVHAASGLASLEAGLPYITRTSHAAEATLEYNGDPELKLAAMALHASQYDPTSPSFQDTIRPYADQLRNELYAVT